MDIRANDAPGAIPAMLRTVFEYFAGQTGADPRFEVPKDKDGNRVWELRHYHVRLLEGEGLQCM